MEALWPRLATGLSDALGRADNWGLLAIPPWWALLALLTLAVLVPPRLGLAALRRKAFLCTYGAAYVALARDGQFQLPPDPGKSWAPVAKTKRIVFVRHGESTWNECFNRKLDASWLARLLGALAREAALLLCLDSVFVDSPLSEEGLEQARFLERFLDSTAGEELRRLCESAVFASSCLRRAAATALTGFGRFLGGGRPVWALSCLQEISRNVDALVLAPPHQPPLLPCPGGPGAGAPPRCLQAAYNLGNKGLTSHGAQRLNAFCEWVFSECSPAALQPTVVVFGHSLWFKAFFQVYLPHTAYHECKHAKIVNCGVVAFDLEQLRVPDSADAEYRVRPESVVSMYGGFEEKKVRQWGRTKGGKKRE